MGFIVYKDIQDLNTKTGILWPISPPITPVDISPREFKIRETLDPENSDSGKLNW